MNGSMIGFDTHGQKALAASGGLHLRMFTDLPSVKHIWLSLEASGVGTLYQSFNWCHTWMEHFGHAKGITPCIVVAENQFGDIAFLLPLQLRRSKGISIIEVLSTPQAGYACGVFGRSFIGPSALLWFENYFDHIVDILPPHDVLRLCDAPETISGFENPLLKAGSFAAANQSHIMDLDHDYEFLLLKHRSKDSRRSMRKRDNKLEAEPDLCFDFPVQTDDITMTMNTLFSQQEARMAEFGVHDVFGLQERQFFKSMALPQQGEPLRAFRLRSQNNILAIILVGIRNGTGWALISSMTGGALRKYSPGDYALRQLIKTLCESGARTLDLSAGDTAYKYHWSDRQVPLRLIIRGNTLKGMPIALYFLLREKIKRVGKRTPLLNTLLFSFRKLVKGRGV